MSARKAIYHDDSDSRDEDESSEPTWRREMREELQMQLDQERQRWTRAQQVKQAMIEQLEQELGRTAETVDAACARQTAEVRGLRDELMSCAEQKDALARGLKEMQQVNREQREAVDAARAELERGVGAWAAERQALQHRMASLEISVESARQSELEITTRFNTSEEKLSNALEDRVSNYSLMLERDKLETRCHELETRTIQQAEEIMALKSRIARMDVKAAAAAGKREGAEVGGGGGGSNGSLDGEDGPLASLSASSASLVLRLEKDLARTAKALEHRTMDMRRQREDAEIRADAMRENIVHTREVIAQRDQQLRNVTALLQDKDYALKKLQSAESKQQPDENRKDAQTIVADARMLLNDPVAPTHIESQRDTRVQHSQGTRPFITAVSPPPPLPPRPPAEHVEVVRRSSTNSNASSSADLPNTMISGTWHDGDHTSFSSPQKTSQHHAPSSSSPQQTKQYQKSPAGVMARVMAQRVEEARRSGSPVDAAKLLALSARLTAETTVAETITGNEHGGDRISMGHSDFDFPGSGEKNTRNIANQDKNDRDDQWMMEPNRIIDRILAGSPLLGNDAQDVYADDDGDLSIERDSPGSGNIYKSMRRAAAVVADSEDDQQPRTPAAAHTALARSKAISPFLESLMESFLGMDESTKQSNSHGGPNGDGNGYINKGSDHGYIDGIGRDGGRANHSISRKNGGTTNAAARGNVKRKKHDVRTKIMADGVTSPDAITRTRVARTARTATHTNGGGRNGSGKRAVERSTTTGTGASRTSHTKATTRRAAATATMASSSLAASRHQPSVAITRKSTKTATKSTSKSTSASRKLSRSRVTLSGSRVSYASGTGGESSRVRGRGVTGSKRWGGSGGLRENKENSIRGQTVTSGARGGRGVNTGGRRERETSRQGELSMSALGSSALSFGPPPAVAVIRSRRSVGGNGHINGGRAGAMQRTRIKTGSIAALGTRTMTVQKRREQQKPVLWR